MYKKLEHTVLQAHWTLKSSHHKEKVKAKPSIMESLAEDPKVVRLAENKNLGNVLDYSVYYYSIKVDTTK